MKKLGNCISQEKLTDNFVPTYLTSLSFLSAPKAPAELNAKVGTSKMVKLTLVGRLRDGLPLSQAPAHLNEDNLVLSSYKYKAELVLKEISRGALTNPKMTVLIDHHCFHCLVGDGICCITLCESWYPRKLAFYYLQDLRNALAKVDRRVLESFSEPYAFKRFDYVIGKIRERYLDTRTQENLFKLNSDRRNDPDIATEELANIMRSCHSSGSEARTSANAQTKSTIWSSQVLEVIALKWTPITIIAVVIAILVWTRIVLNEYDTLTAW
ncbi:25.3 kDa vesicle transport protein-like isoform X1 [Zingiber officinale]|uniref:Longin domain-containing protein n=2 Tax=Zingiber officinale TaxID=94328 RepID=A0A8J5EB27_ZINOF|nr:25.3 kDa vesicle transport protein-like isoform X1 [Zingiber officinale]XP_042446156.1 25.3 kDa vesicle transport protein-like isoform X1 [Zingiber officinale]XP_042446157.1 25.3 kDa vesicle transport protein-like isoform X1 [Zingiber officinale]XP_042446159.1 25.3 kDa vesicle transport protein-like isoform X1 [Zingiber officinale]XP_042446160.1 25.3 kDa vesicle transport protein-like isoform X1 [Zingiber officinale]XP_042446161.1 25.3 kDa vesicle transport protein-like isoform X1 [Zingiber